MRIRLAVPDSVMGADVLEPALENVTRVDEALLNLGVVPRFTQALRNKKVRWQPEPAGHGEHFDAADTVISRGWGDCDDLAPWYAAELRATGQDPGARPVATRSGEHRWHVVVRRSDGSIEDPSLAAGMRRPGVDASKDRHIGAGSVGARVVRWPSVGWLARADLPLSDYHSAAHYALAQDPATAAAEAAISGCMNGMLLDDHEDAAKLGALAQVIGGCPIDEACERWGGVDRAEVGNIFGDIAHAVTSVVSAPAKAVEAVAKPIVNVAEHPLSALTDPLGTLKGLAGGAMGGMQGLMGAVPGMPNVLPLLGQMPGLSSVLQTALPLAQQLLPMFSAATGPLGMMSYPLMNALMSGAMGQMGVR